VLARWLYGAAAVLLTATLVLTYSRGALVVLALQLLTLLLWAAARAIRSRTGAPRPWAALLAAAAAAAALLALPPVRDTIAAVGDLGGYSMQGRLRFWEAALQMLADHPLTGVGLGNFGSYYPQYQRDWMYFSVDPHSWPLQLAAELGIGGVLLTIALLAGLAVWTRRLWRGAGGSLQAVLLTVAVLGSAAHAAIDFDYTFGATCALLGFALAFGTWVARGEPSSSGDPQPAPRAPWTVAARWAAVALMSAAAVFGQLFALERFILDKLRDDSVPPAARQAMLRPAIGYDPYNATTRYQLASVLANARHRDEALKESSRAVELNPRFADALALRGLLSADEQRAQADVDQALKLDPYNSPDLYWYWATLAADDDAKRERLLLGAQRLPIDAPIRPDHLRPEWHRLNPLLIQWWHELALLTVDPAEKELYEDRSNEFRAYWEDWMKENMLDQASVVLHEDPVPQER
jgi:tetratricopeptide (TPR) repeat protein